MPSSHVVSDRRHHGFTLVELMIVVAIIGLLAAIAIPSFQSYQNRSKRSEAMTNLSGIARAQKGFFAEFNTFVGTSTSFPGTGLGPTKRPWSPAAENEFGAFGFRPEGDVYFDYDVNVDDATCVGCFTATAYGEVDANGAASMVQYVEPTPDLTNHLDAAIVPPGLVGPAFPTRSDGTPIYSQVAVNASADLF